jgi:hypothetical protein
VVRPDAPTQPNWKRVNGEGEATTHDYIKRVREMFGRRVPIALRLRRTNGRVRSRPLWHAQESRSAHRPWTSRVMPPCIFYLPARMKRRTKNAKRFNDKRVPVKHPNLRN